MFVWLKKCFIPHEGNEHRPRALRAESALMVVLVVPLLEVLLFLVPVLTRIHLSGGLAAVLSGALSAFSNAERDGQGLSELTVNPLLNEATERKALDMAEKGYFAHIFPGD